MRFGVFYNYLLRQILVIEIYVNSDSIDLDSYRYPSMWYFESAQKGGCIRKWGGWLRKKREKEDKWLQKENGLTFPNFKIGEKNSIGG